MDALRAPVSRQTLLSAAAGLVRIGHAALAPGVRAGAVPGGPIVARAAAEADQRRAAVGHRVLPRDVDVGPAHDVVEGGEVPGLDEGPRLLRGPQVLRGAGQHLAQGVAGVACLEVVHDLSHNAAVRRTAGGLDKGGGHSRGPCT